MLSREDKLVSNSRNCTQKTLRKCKPSKKCFVWFDMAWHGNPATQLIDMYSSEVHSLKNAGVNATAIMEEHHNRAKLQLISRFRAVALMCAIAYIIFYSLIVITGFLKNRTEITIVTQRVKLLILEPLQWLSLTWMYYIFRCSSFFHIRFFMLCYVKHQILQICPLICQLFFFWLYILANFTCPHFVKQGADICQLGYRSLMWWPISISNHNSQASQRGCAPM